MLIGIRVGERRRVDVGEGVEAIDPDNPLILLWRCAVSGIDSTLIVAASWLRRASALLDAIWALFIAVEILFSCFFRSASALQAAMASFFSSDSLAFASFSALRLAGIIILVKVYPK